MLWYGTVQGTAKEKDSKIMALAADPGIASSGLYGNANNGGGAMSG
jgi:hypothetical protein